MTSYLLGKKSSGGSGEQQIVFVTEDNTGKLSIKPSDVIDSEKNFKDKLFILKYRSSSDLYLLPLVDVYVLFNDIELSFGSPGSAENLWYASSISGDEYFAQETNNNVPIPNPLT